MEEILHMGQESRNQDPQALNLDLSGRVRPVGQGGRPVSLDLLSLYCELALVYTQDDSWWRTRPLLKSASADQNI